MSAALVVVTLLLGAAIAKNPAIHQHLQAKDADICQHPGTCTPPDLKYSWNAPGVAPRQQWGTSGGYCGALSVQSISMTHGAYISQRIVRQNAPPGGGHGDPQDGYEILHTNIGTALDKLHLTYTAWDYNTTQPQDSSYKLWLKKMLVSHAPVVWFILCKGDAHDVYGLAHYDHIEPVFGIYSNEALDSNNITYYDSDVIVHGSNWDHNRYYRPMHTLSDTTKMDGNCANAVAGWPHDEAYPCIPHLVDYGVAISGVNDVLGKGMKVSITVSRWDEPEDHAVDMHASVVASGLTSGANYNMLCYHGKDNFPTTSYNQNVHHNVTFAATGTIWKYADGVAFKSDTAVYYFVVPL